MFQYVAPVPFFKLEETILEYGLNKEVNIFKILPNPILQQLGAFFTNMMNKCPVVFLHQETANNMYMESHDITIAQNSAFKSLWHIKDCSVFIRNGFLFNQNTYEIVMSENSESFTCSDGKNHSLMFSRAEINKSQEIVKKLKLICNEDLLVPDGEFNENSYRTGYYQIPYNEFNKFSKALRFIDNARKSISILEKISWYIVAIEALFKFHDKADLQFKLSYRVPHFLTKNPMQKEEIYNTVKDGYELRSNLLHGGAIEKKQLRTIERQLSISKELDELLRRTFQDITEDENKHKILIDEKKFKDFFHNAFIQ